MAEFLSALIQPAILPVTILLSLVLLYWLLVVIGATTVHSLDFDLGLDGHGVDHVSVDHVPFGLAPAVLQFFHLREVPVTMVGSLFALVWWTGTMLANVRWNPGHLESRGWLLLLASAIVSLITTKLLTMPLVPLFRSLNREMTDRLQPGQLAHVSTTELTDQFGEITIERNGPPIVMNARCHGARLRKGDEVVLISLNSENNTWLVQLSKQDGKN